MSQRKQAALYYRLPPLYVAHASCLTVVFLQVGD
jgi:hypothetical protein